MILFCSHNPPFAFISPKTCSTLLAESPDKKLHINRPLLSHPGANSTGPVLYHPDSSIVPSRASTSRNDTSIGHYFTIQGLIILAKYFTIQIPVFYHTEPVLHHPGQVIHHQRQRQLKHDGTKLCTTLNSSLQENMRFPWNPSLNEMNTSS